MSTPRPSSDVDMTVAPLVDTTYIAELTAAALSPSQVVTDHVVRGANGLVRLNGLA